MVPSNISLLCVRFYSMLVKNLLPNPSSFYICDWRVGDTTWFFIVSAPTFFHHLMSPPPYHNPSQGKIIPLPCNILEKIKAMGKPSLKNYDGNMASTDDDDDYDDDDDDENIT